MQVRKYPALYEMNRRGAFDAGSLGSAVRARGLDVQSVRPVPVSLEDAFVRLVQKQAGEGGA